MREREREQERLMFIVNELKRGSTTITNSNQIRRRRRKSTDMVEGERVKCAGRTRRS